ncbi:MAG: UvrD-helicase domain-containing protein [Cyanobacteria bacterium]|nr:UvrD-helicase domain-containing protein [Cyanobacteriota bacterium]
MQPSQEDSTRFNPISLVRASAGTGKTYFLTEEFAKILVPHISVPSGVGPFQIIATTFTNKAADELMQRIRSRLTMAGAYELAQLVRGSYIGTVHSCFGRLMSDFALEGGLSPSIKVVDELGQQRIFLACAEGVLSAASERLDELAYSLSIDDWRKHVVRIVEVARENDISREILLSTSNDSWDTLVQVLPEPLSTESADRLDIELAHAIQSVINIIKQSDDDTKLTQDAADFLRIANSTLEKNRSLPWSTWARISKLRVARKTQSEVTDLRNIASQYLRHPRLRSNWKEFIDTVVTCSVKSMDGYSAFKREHGLIDFADQEVLAKRILDSGLISEDIREKCKILMVDEFQDTSPIQLSVFLQLARSVRSSLFVGDVKQSIFGFRGSDPELMHRACSQLSPNSGGAETHLSTSYRSRSELVSFSNALFSACMPAFGISEEIVRISNFTRESFAEMESPIHFWWLNGKTLDDSLMSLAAGLLRILDEPGRFMVQDAETNQLRPIVGSDIVVLCRSNDHRLRVASQLAFAGIQVATERPGLLDTPECVLAGSALRFMVDPYDTLAAATIIRFSSDGVDWLSKWLESGFDEYSQSVPILQSISKQRSRLRHLTPLETLELAIVGSGILEIVKGYDDFRQRTLNLDALRGLARAYEDDCLATGRIATAAGLIAHLDERPIDFVQPRSSGIQAVDVLTYHKAKGLEWPLVILFDLDHVKVGTAFGITVDQKVDLDINSPLEGRTLRYWPWPFGRHRVDVDLGNTLTSPVALSASAKARSESTRLMYVGVTRARDYLVFAARPTNDGMAWLKELKDVNDRPILSLPSENGRHEILRDAKGAHYVEVVSLEPISPKVERQRKSAYTTPQTQSVDKSEIFPYRATPSKTLPASDRSYFVSERIVLGERIPLTVKDDVQVIGDVVHYFFAADDSAEPIIERIQLGRELLSRWKVSSMNPVHLVSISNRLQKALDSRFPKARLICECPVYGFKGIQRVRGSVDMLLYTDEGFVVIDHKTYFGRLESCDAKVLSYAPQLFTYKELIEAATSSPVIACYVHLPLVGQLFRIGEYEQTHAC